VTDDGLEYNLKTLLKLVFQSVWQMKWDINITPPSLRVNHLTKDGNPYGCLSLGRSARGRGFGGQATFIWLEEECIQNKYRSTI
jgi:hypothetical protein